MGDKSLYFARVLRLSESRSNLLGWEIDLVLIGWANLVIFAAALFSSITGFGYALLATPVLLLFLAPKIVVPIVLMSSMPLSLLLAREAYGDMSKAKIGLWLLGALPGMVFGAYGLAHFDEGVMRVGIGAVTILAALSVWSKPDSPFVKERMMAIVAGGGSGAMVGVSGVSGPPVVLFGLNQGWDFRVLRACLIGYFTLLHAATILVLGRFGMVNSQTLTYAAGVLPGLLLGYCVGVRLKDHIDSGHFRTITLCMVSLAGIAAILSQ